MTSGELGPQDLLASSPFPSTQRTLKHTFIPLDLASGTAEVDLTRNILRWFDENLLSTGASISTPQQHHVTLCAVVTLPGQASVLDRIVQSTLELASLMQLPERIDQPAKIAIHQGNLLLRRFADQLRVRHPMLNVDTLVLHEQDHVKALTQWIAEHEPDQVLLFHQKSIGKRNSIASLSETPDTQSAETSYLSWFDTLFSGTETGRRLLYETTGPLAVIQVPMIDP